MKNLNKKIRLYIGYLFGLFILLVAKPTILSYWIGFAVVLLGEVIRTWAAGYLVKDKLLVKNGPYRLIRNPLYLGSFLIGLGAVIIGHSLLLLSAFILLFLGAYLPTIFREEKFLAQKFAADYLNYQKTIPSFFPFIGSILRKRNFPSELKFSWQRVKKNREFHTWIVLFLILIILGLKLKL
ncbi:MAG: isoprenylcysteine carboxylmethyltransferase family protein [Candidatus Omnitrophica bacterium]|nr:isoprenylcysteine carboxylmethyltransferase family protein [Candidatus Omnitrophota bacterium]